jgi:DNA-binding LacI/PurR family transcriptional regulator
VVLQGAGSRRPSMDDVGRRAGVSHQTVSRVLNANSYVSAQTRERVLAAIEELNYRPNQSARSLARRRTDSVGVITMGGPGHGLLASILEGISREAVEQGFSISINNLEISLDERNADDLVEAAFESFISEGVGGVIIISAYAGVMKALERESSELPIVLVFGQPAEGIGTATIDPHHGGKLAAEHLLSLGHRAIAHVAGPSNRFDSIGREAGFREALAKQGLEPVVVLRGDFSSDSGYAVGSSLRQRTDFTAIFSGNDQMALGLLHAFEEVGRRAPNDISIVGYDDIPDASHYIPPLTTIRQDFVEIGARSFRELSEAIDRGTFTHVNLLPELIVRASTALISSS